MEVGEFRTVLGQLMALYSEAGARTPAGDLERLLRLLDGHDGKTVDQFLADLRDSLELAIPRPKSVNVNLAVIGPYVERLTSVGTDKISFDQLMDVLDRDLAVGKVEMDFIAHAFVGGRQSWKSRNLALEAVRTRFAERAYQASKMKELEKFTPW